jgi:hypothetical protein
VSPRKSTETPVTPRPTGPHRKPQPDLYTVLLIIALVAVLIGIVFLYLEMDSYKFEIKGGPPVVMVEQWPAVGGQLSVHLCRKLGLQLHCHPTDEFPNPQSLIPNPFAEHGCSTSKTS